MVSRQSTFALNNKTINSIEMQKRILWFALILMMASTLQVKAQYGNQDSTYKKFL